MKWIKRVAHFLGRAYDKQIDATGLAVFRIVYSCVLIAEILELWKYEHLIYDEVPFLVTNQTFNLHGGFTLWIVVLLFIVFGLYTRIAAIINYIFAVVYLSGLHAFEYHVDYIYAATNFLMIFMPVSRSLSLDNLRLRWNHLKRNQLYQPSGKASQLSYYIIPFVGIAFIYWNSALHKFTSPQWLSGLGVWLPSSLPPVTIMNDQGFLNQEILVKALGYFVVLFELVFIYTFWFRRYRLAYFIIGVIFHIGIFMEYPIPLFSLTVLASYIPLFPVAYWKKLRASLQAKRSVATVRYDAGNKNATKMFHLLKSFDFFRKLEFQQQTNTSGEEGTSLIYQSGNEKELRGHAALMEAMRKTRCLYLLYLLSKIPMFQKRLAIQFNPWLNTSKQVELSPVYEIEILETLKGEWPIAKRLAIGGIFVLMLLEINADTQTNMVRISMRQVIPKEHTFWKYFDGYQGAFTAFTSKYLGIRHHRVFMDFHFKDYNHITTITYETPEGETKWLPVMTEDGLPGPMSRGRLWIFWTFRTMSPHVKMHQFKKGVKRVTAFWAHENGVDLSNAKFNVLYKYFPKHENMDWEEDYLTRQLEKPWQKIGEVVWTEFEAEVNVPEIEQLR